MEMHTHGKFKCELCKGIRFTLRSLIWHQKRCHPEIDPDVTARECTICNATFSTPKSLSMEKVSSTKFHRKRKWEIRQILGMHQKVHDIGTLKCDRCDIRFTVQSLLRHQKQFHPDILRMAVKQPCEICKVMCYSQSALGTKSNLRQKWFCYANKIFRFSCRYA